MDSRLLKVYRSMVKSKNNVQKIVNKPTSQDKIRKQAHQLFNNFLKNR